MKKIAYLVFIAIVALWAGLSRVSAACHTHSDPLGLANGTDILFIDQNNCNCSDPTSPRSSSTGRTQALNPATPWCSFLPMHGAGANSSNARILSGDTIYVREGVYVSTNTLNFWKSGTPARQTSIKRYGTDHVAYQAGSYDYAFGIAIEADYVTIDGLDIVGHVPTTQGTLYSPLPLHMSGKGNQVLNSLIRDYQGFDDIGYGFRHPPENANREAWGRALNVTNSEDMVIRNTFIRCTESLDGLTQGKLIGEGFLCEGCTNVLVENSKFERCGHQSLSIRESSNMTIQNNDITNDFHTGMSLYLTNDSTVRNNVFHDWDTIPTSVGGSGNAIQVQSASRNKIYNNIFFNAAYNANGVSIGSPQHETTLRANDNEVYNNTFYDVGTVGIFVGHYAGWSVTGAYVNNNKVFNNIVYGVRPYLSYEAYPIQTSLFNPQLDNGNGNMFNNNLLFNFNSAPIIYRTVNLGVLTEMTDAELNNLSYADGNLTANPLFTDIATHNFSPQATSPALNQPCYPGLSIDFFGNPRPANNCTLGAIEYTAVVLPPIIDPTLPPIPTTPPILPIPIDRATPTPPSTPGAAGGPLDAVRATPNPLAPGTSQMTIQNLPIDAEIHIYTRLGEEIFAGRADANGECVWQGRNKDQERVTSGIYFVHVKAGEHERTFNIAVIR